MGTPRSPANRVLRKGLSPLATTISTDLAGAGDHGYAAARKRAGSGKGAARMVAQAICHRPRGGRDRRDPGPRRLGVGHTRCVVNACRRAGTGFSSS